MVSVPRAAALLGELAGADELEELPDELPQPAARAITAQVATAMPPRRSLRLISGTCLLYDL
jgi:hypothetical protein